MIQLINISKNYGKFKILDDISFSLKEGEITAFLGANGVGKTTTMNIMMGILKVDSGKVLINGADLSKSNIAIKKIIGYLPENNPLYGDMYVKEYLEYVASLYMRQKEIRPKVIEVIERLDLKDESSKKIQNLSHGNRQRVGLAQAIIHDPDILILDEPTNGLDPSQQYKINSLIKDLGKSKTIFFSSHRLDDVADIATRYIGLKDGKLAMDVGVENLDKIKNFFYTTNV